jgi:hypothetical protein
MIFADNRRLPVAMMEPHVRCGPERRLAVAMVQQALFDLRSGWWETSARVWLLSKNDQAFSFRWCADVLEFDADRALQAMGFRRVERNRFTTL